MTLRLSSTLVVAAYAATFLVAASAAHAQDALGNGDALDRNSQVGSGGRNSQRPSNPYAGRNSVVTGEVIGGREFRGRVGYTAPGDFRGNLGSNTLYRFQADSAWSGPIGFATGTATYDQLRFGQGLGVLELARSGSGSTAATVQQAPGPVQFSEFAASRLRYDNEILTATSSSRLIGGAQSTTLGTATLADGRMLALSASGVRGLTTDQFNQRWSDLGLSAYDQARAREEAAAAAGAPAKPEDKTKPTAKDDGSRVGVAFETRFDSGRTDASATGEARVDATQQPDYARVLQNIADRYANVGGRDVKIDPGVLKTLTEQYQSLRNQLAGEDGLSAGPRQTTDPTAGRSMPVQPPSPQAPTASSTPGRPESYNPADPRNQRDPRNRLNQPDETTGEGDKPQPKEGEKEAPDLSQLGAALRHGEKIERFSSAEQGRFNELMMAAEQQLKDGDYMLAEQRFQRALRFSPGHPLAMAGAANAQIGAGLYLPAGYTLRALFTQHPEMIDATYAEGLVPPRERLDAAVAAMQARLDSPVDRSASALLLAYLGRQIGDRTLMEQGIKAMQAASADDPLPKLLQTVWLEGGEVPKPEK